MYLKLCSQLWLFVTLFPSEYAKSISYIELSQMYNVKANICYKRLGNMV